MKIVLLMVCFLHWCLACTQQLLCAPAVFEPCKVYADIAVTSSELLSVSSKLCTTWCARNVVSCVHFYPLVELYIVP